MNKTAHNRPCTTCWPQYETKNNNFSFDFLELTYVRGYSECLLTLKRYEYQEQQKQVDISQFEDKIQDRKLDTIEPEEISCAQKFGDDVLQCSETTEVTVDKSALFFFGSTQAIALIEKRA